MGHIVTDSTADLGPEIAQRYGIQIVPLSVHIGGQVYRDGIDIGPEQVYALVEELGELPKTAAPSIAEYACVFDRPEDCLYIGISSRLSSSVQNARLAAADFAPGHVRVVDSLNLSTGVGLLALAAAELRDHGCTAEEIEREVWALTPRVRTAFVIDTLRYLYLGGRCTALQSIGGSLIKLHPIIQVQPDGTLGVGAKVRGDRRRGVAALLADFEAHLGEVDLHRVFVTHSGCIADAEYLATELRRFSPAPEEVLITQAGCVISSHCGPNTVGILYIRKPAA